MVGGQARQCGESQGDGQAWEDGSVGTHRVTARCGKMAGTHMVVARRGKTVWGVTGWMARRGKTGSMGTHNSELESIINPVFCVFFSLFESML